VEIDLPTPAAFLVTGGAGFIGSHLTDELLARGHRVVVLDDLSTGELANLDGAARNPSFTFVHGSVLDDVVDELVESAHIVVHLAAVVGVRRVVDRPLQAFITNVRGTELVIQAAQRHRRKILLASSSEVYGKNAAVPLAEDSALVLGPTTVARWSYAIGKAADEMLAYAYHREWALETVVVRLFNTVGPRQDPGSGMVLPRLVSQALTGQPMTVHGAGAQTRCFCHVSDVVAAMLALLETESAIGQPVNIGTTEEVSILDLANRIRARVGSASPVQVLPYEAIWDRDFEDLPRRVPDTTRLRRLTGWAPRRSLRDIIDDVAAHMSETSGLDPISPAVR
jgi:UDP-glucose 4-epimerase